MRTRNTLAGLCAAAALLTITLIGCSKTKNNTDTVAAAPVATQCIRQADGTFRDGAGRFCNSYGYSANSCTNARLNPQTGQYYDLTTGQPVQCNYNGYFGNYSNSLPYYGYNSYGQSFTGCQGWSMYYPGNYYVPVDLGNGQMICMNSAYLTQYYPQYQNYWQQAAYYQQPVYTCMSMDCYAYQGGYGYGGYGYNTCTSQLNLGFDFGYGGANFGMCF